MERSEVFTFQMLLANSGAIASPGIPGSVQILFADLDRGSERTLEHKIGWSFGGVTDFDPSMSAQVEDRMDLSEIRSDMIAAGMKEVAEPPTDEQLRLYYAFHAPAHEAIRENRFVEAAVLYRWLAIGATEGDLRDRYATVARQLQITHQIRTLCHRNVSFPPRGSDIEDYFLGLAGLPVSEIQVAFQKYFDAFYIQPMGISNLWGADTKQREPQEEWCTQIPVSWEDIQDGELNYDGRRLLDSVSLALLGQKCLKAAGFSTGQFAVASNRSSCPQNPALSTIMFTAKRALIDTRRGATGIHTEVAVVANGAMQWAVAQEFLEIEAAEELLLWSAFQTALGIPIDQSSKILQERLIRHQELAETLTA